MAVILMPRLSDVKSGLKRKYSSVALRDASRKISETEEWERVRCSINLYLLKADQFSDFKASEAPTLSWSVFQRLQSLKRLVKDLEKLGMQIQRLRAWVLLCWIQGGKLGEGRTQRSILMDAWKTTHLPKEMGCKQMYCSKCNIWTQGIPYGKRVYHWTMT